MLKRKLGATLIQIARFPMVFPLVKFFFKHMGQHLPIDRISENSHWMAFHHPRPAYPLHILILPKDGITSLLEAPTDQPEIYTDLIEIVKTLVKNNQLDEKGYRLITNGGNNQSLPQWHWHLIGELDGDTHA